MSVSDSSTLPVYPLKLSSSSGFTLIEMVISAALMSMILVSAYLCLESGFSSQKLIESRDEILQSARVAMALVNADLRHACPLSKDFAFLGMDRTAGEVEADNLDFATHNYTPRRPREGDFCEVSYFLEKDPESGQFTLWRRRDPTPDPEPLDGGNREEIARGLRGLRFEYYDGFDWYDEWGDPEGKRTGQNSLLDRANLSGMPEAVRVTLRFDPRPAQATESSAETGSEEPPFVFQTVARLNLAAVAQRGAASGSSGISGSGAASQPVQATTAGGRN
ncbi:MAG: type II secretion system protein GspJ [Verrucomicrobiota bacterium]